jgi:hypothetical protein
MAKKSSFRVGRVTAYRRGNVWYLYDHESGNTIHDPQSPRGRLIWAQKTNEGLVLADNLIVGPPIQITSADEVQQQGNVVRGSLDQAAADVEKGVGQTRLTPAQMRDAIELPARIKAARPQADK